MRYLLDSNTISELYDTGASHHPAILGHLGALTDRDQVCISVLSLYELEYGWANAPDEKKPAVRQVIADAQSDFEVLPPRCREAVKASRKMVRTGVAVLQCLHSSPAASR